MLERFGGVWRRPLEVIDAKWTVFIAPMFALKWRYESQARGVSQSGKSWSCEA
jgi:hypothetical protein